MTRTPRLYPGFPAPNPTNPIKHWRDVIGLCWEYELDLNLRSWEIYSRRPSESTPRQNGVMEVLWMVAIKPPLPDLFPVETYGTEAARGGWACFI